MSKFLWSIVSPNYTIHLTLYGNWFFTWIFKKLMKNREVKIIKNKLKGQSFDVVYGDEFI